MIMQRLCTLTSYIVTKPKSQRRSEERVTGGWLVLEGGAGRRTLGVCDKDLSHTRPSQEELAGSKQGYGSSPPCSSL